VRLPKSVDVVIVTAPGIRLAHGAAAALAATLRERRADLVSCDSVVFGAPAPRPVLKPRWSPHLLRSGPYIGPAFAVRRDRFEAAGGAAQSGHALLLHLSDLCTYPVHLNRTWAASTTPFGFAADPDAVAADFGQRALTAEATARSREWVALHLEPLALPRVTAIIPTRNGIDRVRHLLSALPEDLQLVVVDNGSDDGRTAPYLTDLALAGRIELLDFPHPFNFSTICNLGLSTVDTELTLFLNDDIHPVDERWLLQLAANLDDPTIGTVGPLLTFPDGRIQHAGVVLGLGGAAGHPFAGWTPEDDGYFGWSLARREIAALTAACLLVRTDLAKSLDGFDEQLPTDFQDVDFCLRISDAGYANVIDPGARLIHAESSTRGQADADPGAAAYLQRKWGSRLTSDPWYSSRLPATNPGYAGPPPA
jgi:GT2 family glycosyltransferase